MYRSSALRAGTPQGSRRARTAAAVLALVCLLAALTFVVTESGSLRAYAAAAGTVDVGTTTSTSTTGAPSGSADPDQLRQAAADGLVTL